MLHGKSVLSAEGMQTYACLNFLKALSFKKKSLEADSCFALCRKLLTVYFSAVDLCYISISHGDRISPPGVTIHSGRSI